LLRITCSSIVSSSTTKTRTSRTTRVGFIRGLINTYLSTIKSSHPAQSVIAHQTALATWRNFFRKRHDEKALTQHYSWPRWLILPRILEQIARNQNRDCDQYLYLLRQPKVSIIVRGDCRDKGAFVAYGFLDSPKLFEFLTQRCIICVPREAPGHSQYVSIAKKEHKPNENLGHCNGELSLTKLLYRAQQSKLKRQWRKGRRLGNSQGAINGINNGLTEMRTSNELRRKEAKPSLIHN